MKLRRSPFKVNVVENDPHAFGLRAKEIISCIETLYNDRSLLLSGPRGIGKSSMGYQLQRVMEGNPTLLKRCHIETKFPRTLCVFYACDSEHTLEQLTLDILYRLEDEARRLPKKKVPEVKAGFEVNLGIIKASLETAIESGNRSPGTIASQFVTGLEMTLKAITRLNSYHGINIMLDELDQLSPDIKFGHFIKILHETLAHKGLKQITFIFAGQKGIYTRFLKENPSFERIVRHVPLSILDGEASRYVLDYAANQASPRFKVDKHAHDLIVSISSGYPYTLHLLGDAAFWEMKDHQQMTQEDVAYGIEAILKSDKREKYFNQFKKLSRDERIVLIALTEYSANNIPSQIPYSSLLERTVDRIESTEVLDAAIEALVQNGYLISRKEQTSLMFAEELFRIFISITVDEQRRARINKIQEERGAQLSKKQEAEIVRFIEYGDVDYDEIRLHLSDAQRAEVFGTVRKTLFGTGGYTTAWEDDEEEADLLNDDFEFEYDEADLSSGDADFEYGYLEDYYDDDEFDDY